MKKLGKLHVPLGVELEAHELDAIRVLLELGFDVMVIQPRIGYKMRTPDITMNGLDWEIKSPLGKTRESISRQIKKAAKQSPNVILDIRGCQVDEEDVMKQVHKDIVVYKRIKHLKLITATRVIDIK